MGRFLTFALILILSWPFSSADAYDVDTHFYGTYAMARHAGIRKEVALKIALSAQWMDESYISDPTSMIVLPITGIRKRRLLHFASDRVVGGLGAETQKRIREASVDLEKYFDSIVGKLVEYTVGAIETEKLKYVNIITETQEDHEFASELLMLGMKQGNLMMSAASLHVLEDSFAHAGTGAEKGHADLWHWPDRPFAFVPKYERMTGAVFMALVGIRRLLPPEALDCELQNTGSVAANCKLNAETLAASYFKLVQPTISYNVLNDPEYIKVALREFFVRAQAFGYTNVAPEVWMQDVNPDGTQNTIEVLTDLIVRKVRLQSFSSSDSLNICRMLRDTGRYHCPRGGTQEDQQRAIFNHIRGYGTPISKGMKRFVERAVMSLMRWYVPQTLSDTHHHEIEDDSSPIRAKEMEIRIRGMRQLITNFYGENIQFVPNKTSHDGGFALEIALDPRAEPEELKLNTPESKVTYATFSGLEKNQWDHMIFHYLFPSFSREDLVDIVNVGRTVKTLLGYDAKIKPDIWMRLNAARYATFKFKYVVTTLVGDIVGRDGQEVEDHLLPSPDVFDHRIPDIFEGHIRTGYVRPYLADGDTWQASALFGAGNIPQP